MYFCQHDNVLFNTKYLQHYKQMMKSDGARGNRLHFTLQTLPVSRFL